MYLKHPKLLTLLLFIIFHHTVSAQHSIARQWNEALLDGIRKDLARPTVHARNLFHISVAMYDSWAVYNNVAEPWLLGNSVGNYESAFNGFSTIQNKTTARNETISYAAYRLLTHRFQNSPGAATVLPEFDALMAELGYDKNFTSTDYSTGSPAALGNYIAQDVIAFGLQDGANEADNYAPLFYEPINPALVLEGNEFPEMVDANRWQPLGFGVFIDQSGNEYADKVPEFVSPEWGRVVPFSLTENDLVIHQRDGHDWWVYHDPGAPPFIDLQNGGLLSEEYKWNFELVSIWSAQLDATDGAMWDISPASIGNLPELPETFADYHEFYDLENGGDHSPGYTINPKTGLPYAPQLIPRGDYTRILAEFWADGPNSETPPGHWFTILNYINDHPQLEKRFEGSGPVIDNLEWDIKSYFMLGGAMHDAAVTAWGIKGYYDYIRPISAIRSMCLRGQCSDEGLPNFDIGGVHLIPGYIEQIEAGDELAGPSDENVGKIKLKAWRGPDYVSDPVEDVAGVGWILAEDWWPYQRPTFVTPPFAGYISGHSTFSRTAAELLTLLTGDPYFPGGIGEFEAPQNEFLVFEKGPSVNAILQWAKYNDASDQCSLSRIWGGIHPPADDIPGRKIGMVLGPNAFNRAKLYFEGKIVVSVEDDPFGRGNEFNIVAYPNPSFQGDRIAIELSKPENNFSLILLDITGRHVYSKDFNNGPQRIVTLDQLDLKPGAYIVQVRNNYKKAVAKVFISK